ncbi:Protein rds1 [Purpureocillium lavendulum]|uniref:Protein rds1 n=1 Tax=Purpureocillium lavendulum TaxID=1247861 RepID=A0AB34FS84_9HYPO|nr:Protein rds1 [Purpureocillium lavendulum]
MPTALHPQAKFDPIPPDLDLPALVDRTPNFKWVQRVSRTQIRNLGQQEFEKLVQIHVIAGGKPLVIDGWDSVLPGELFSVEWLERTYDKKQENVRDIPASSDIPMTMGHYLRSMKQLTNQWTPHTFRDERRQRLYLKDIDCPPEWHDALQKVIQPSLFYLNENVATSGGPDRQGGDLFRGEATAAPAGDLMSSLPLEMRAQNLMCYIGHEGTYTPAHREMCASLGQNIMVEASRDGAGEKAGSSIWFMTESKDREVVREYFLSMLGHDIEIEKHFAQVNAWKKAPFDVGVVEQRPGDFILIPPLAAHQVWNRGTRTMKVAWNRTTAETLDMALHEALPKARLVCRDEQYKNKAIIYFTLQKYFQELQEMEEKADMAQMSFMGIGHDIVRNSPRAKHLASDFKRLFTLFSEVLVDEVFATKEKEVEFLPFDSCVTCSYCRSNIFNRFLTCKHCVRTLANGDEDAYDICMECYAMGRSCACLSGLQWCEQWSWSELVDSYENWRAMVIISDGYIDLQNSPPPFEIARQKSGKKSVAQICQEALKRRPWKDITKPEREKTPSDSEQGDDDEKSKKKPKRKKKKGELRRCHVCCHKDYSYRVHECTNPGCTEGYCYGVLYRAFDMMPQKVLEDEYWQCPKCLGICSCGGCRRSGNTDAYTPKTTHLGHDTRPIADDRSVEALVDFRVHNLSWLKAVGEESRSKDSRRMQRLREQADSAKAQDLTHQVEAGRAVPDDTEATDTANIAPATTGVNGYGDQSEVFGPQSSAMDGFSQGLEGGRIDGASTGINGPALPGDSDMGDIDTSSYPDPSVLVRQRIGMGYYEQDDTPDKILFDPYQAPSEEVMKIRDDSEIPEFVKKSIRAAKRRARRENEDPDFIVGRSHHTKKPRLTQQTDALESMDPALFDSPTAPAPTTRTEVEGDNTRPSQHSDTPASRSDETPQRRQAPLWFDANEPELRHAKPLASYVEVEDAEVDDAEELSVAAQSPRPTERPRGPPRSDAIDAAADDIRGIFGAQAEAPGPAAPSASAPKRRGRPPKRLSVAAAAPDDGEMTTSLSSPIVESEGEKKRRGRPRTSAVGTNTASRKSNNGKGARRLSAANNVEAQLVAEMMSQAAPEKLPPRRRGRRPGVTTIAAASAEWEEVEGSDNETSEPPPPIATPTAGRGKPTASSRKKAATPASDPQFMSLAERMALKGKKFKIGQRKTVSGDAATRNVLSSPAEADAAEATDERSTSGGETSVVDRGYRDGVRVSKRANGAEQQTAWPMDLDASDAKGEPRQSIEDRAPAKQTVVRLADVGSEDESSAGSSSSSAIGSGDEDDIPSEGNGARSRGALANADDTQHEKVAGNDAGQYPHWVGKGSKRLLV